MDSPHSLHHHRLSSSFADSAIDLDLTDRCISKSPALRAHALPAPDRLVSLANLAACRALSGPASKQDDSALHHYIDSIESFLDPRPELSRAIAQNRPQSPRSSSRTVTGLSTTASTKIARADPVYQSVNRQLETLLGELSQANVQLQLRRVESRHIHDLFTLKCEGLAQKILQLEDEVDELKSDILEDSIELEGLRGTVCGLESWVGRWQRQREISGAHAATLPPQRKGRGRQKRRLEKADPEEENDCDLLLEGISAWMRGWRDVTEGFQIRARRRKMRRELSSAFAQDRPPTTS